MFKVQEVRGRKARVLHSRAVVTEERGAEIADPLVEMNKINNPTNVRREMSSTPVITKEVVILIDRLKIKAAMELEAAIPESALLETVDS